MAIADVLWACPICGEIDGLRRERRHERCSRCATAFRRGRRDEIVAHPRQGGEQRRSAAAWLRGLPPLEAGQPHVGPLAAGERFRAAAAVRTGQAARPLYRRGELLGWIERFGAAVHGEIVLDAESIGFEVSAADRANPADRADRSDAGGGGGGGSTHAAVPARGGWRWPLESLRVLQPTSAALQIRRREEPLVAIRLLDSSVLLWEVRLQVALQARWTELGRGVICEFQPRICTA